MKNKDLKNLLRSVPLVEPSDDLNHRIQVTLAQLDLLDSRKSLRQRYVPRFAFSGACLGLILMIFIFLSPSDDSNKRNRHVITLDAGSASVFDTTVISNEYFLEEKTGFIPVASHKKKRNTKSGGKL
ncbi:hypothetical protein K8T06_13865 [bacterium]|nr:hypothetical protein [bacterium]